MCAMTESNRNFFISGMVSAQSVHQLQIEDAELHGYAALKHKKKKVGRGSF